MKSKREIKSSKYHVVWTPKYRKKFLYGLIKYYVEKSIKYKSLELNIRIEKMEIMPDHVHLFLSIPVTISISKVIQQLKGYSSYETRKHLKLYKYKYFWSNGYFCESVGCISEETIKKYIDNQWSTPNSSGD